MKVNVHGRGNKAELHYRIEWCLNALFWGVVELQLCTNTILSDWQLSVFESPKMPYPRRGGNCGVLSERNGVWLAGGV